MKEKYQALFEPFTYRSGIQVKNRVVMAPMTNFSSNPDGTVTDGEVEYYERRSNGVGMVITACTYATPNGKGFNGEFAADSDEMIPSLQRLASAIQARGAKAVLQIFHGGRECPPDLVPNGDVVSASDVASTSAWAVAPRPLTEEEILSIIRDFGAATRRAIEAGYDGVEIHGANGYLIHQFFSPHTNRREDRWGGSIENRMAFALAIVDEVQKVVAEHAKGSFLVGYRFSPEEPEEPGITMDDTLVLVDALADKSLDYLHISLMDYKSMPRRSAEGVERSRLQLVQDKVGDRVPVMGVGAIRTPDEALEVIQTVPLLAIGRELIIEPDWVEKVAEGRESEIPTVLSKRDKERLVIPEPLWQAILNSGGWFPIAD